MPVIIPNSLRLNFHIAKKKSVISEYREKNENKNVRYVLDVNDPGT